MSGLGACALLTMLLNSHSAAPAEAQAEQTRLPSKDPVPPLSSEHSARESGPESTRVSGHEEEVQHQVAAKEGVKEPVGKPRELGNKNLLLCLHQSFQNTSFNFPFR